MFTSFWCAVENAKCIFISASSHVDFILRCDCGVDHYSCQTCIFSRSKQPMLYYSDFEKQKHLSFLIFCKLYVTALSLLMFWSFLSATRWGLNAEANCPTRNYLMTMTHASATNKSLIYIDTTKKSATWSALIQIWSIEQFKASRNYSTLK